jgi:GAF domain-containing protein
MDRLVAFGAEDLKGELDAVASRAVLLAPTIMGFSLGVVQHDITVTYVATDAEIALLDAVQYLDGGPCLRAAETGATIDVNEPTALDEVGWQLFAQATAAAGVRSTLSLPLLDDDRVIGGVNLYGSRSDTFAARRDELATLFGAWGPGAVSNADLGFQTRLAAAQAPRRLDELHILDRAAGIVMARHDVTLELARLRLEEAAARAGLPVVAVAQALLDGGELGSD